jgi:hypothetical protein
MKIMIAMIPRTRNTIHGTPAFICGGAVDFGLEALYLPIRWKAVTLTDVIWRRQTSLLFAGLLLGSCATSPPKKPDLPDSISPGWKLSSISQSAEGEPACWKADYAGPGSAEVRICWYKAMGSAFDAVQRARAEAQTVKFQVEHYFVLVKWNNAPKPDLTALVRAIQKALAPKS